MADHLHPAHMLHAEIHGGELDGASVDLIDTRKVALTLVVDGDGVMHMQSCLTPDLIVRILDRCAEIARIRAAEWAASQS